MQHISNEDGKEEKLVEYMTVVIRLPEDIGDRKKISSALHIGNMFHGGQITAMSVEDEMTVLELIESHDDFDHEIAEHARAKAKELHATAESAS